MRKAGMTFTSPHADCLGSPFREKTRVPAGKNASPFPKKSSGRNLEMAEKGHTQKKLFSTLRPTAQTFISLHFSVVAARVRGVRQQRRVLLQDRPRVLALPSPAGHLPGAVRGLRGAHQARDDAHARVLPRALEASLPRR